MLKAQKRLTKREIKQDKFVTFYFRAREFLDRHQKELMYGAVTVIAILAVVFIFMQKRASSEQKAVVELAKAQTKFFAGDHAGAIPILSNLVESYSGTASGTSGKFYLAGAYFEQGNYDEAERHYRGYLSDGDDPLLLSSSMSGIAACLEGRGDYIEAAKKYEEAARTYSAGFLAPDQLYHAARCYARAGDTAAATRLLDEILTRHEKSAIKGDAEILRAELRT